VLVSVAVVALVTLGLIAAQPRVLRDLSKVWHRVTRIPERVWAHVVPRWASHKTRRPGETDLLAALSAPERDAVATLAGRLDGLIVWASNRSGRHQLYLVDLHGRSVRQLTRAPAVHYFARIAPDGRQVVFMRSQRESVSVRDLVAWDLYLINVDGTGEQRIAVGGIHPGWTADGTGIVFHRASRLFRYDVRTHQETMLFDAAAELPGIEADLGDVELAPDGRRLAFVLRGQFSGAHGLRGAVSGAAVFELDTRRLTLLTRDQACQTTWTPDGQWVAWMATGGNGETRIMAGRADGSEGHVLMDLPGPRSHEYFPKFSNDGRWLVWGATAEGHEQDGANYEIFVWEVGTPWDTAIRLTHDQGNSNWPDLWVRPHA
jgi:Tol biopolymer transport system component